MAFPSVSRKRLARGLSRRPKPTVPGKREVRLEELEPRNLLSVLNLEFGTASSPLAAGYTKVTESTMYSAPQGFGWLTYGVTSRDRGVGSDLTRAFNFTGNGTFGAALANGTYAVSVLMGDAIYAHNNMELLLQGTQVDTVSTAVNQFYSKTFQTQVNNGQLLVGLASADGVALINALTITPVSSPPGSATPPPPLAGTGAVMNFLTFTGPTPPVNNAGAGYPTYYYNPGVEGGIFTTGINSRAGPYGPSLQMNLTTGKWYAQFNPYNADGSRGFARQYGTNPTGWQFDTYNRLSFWIKLPTSYEPFFTDGNHNVELGSYVKKVANEDPWSDETGGGHYYHELNIPTTGVWTQVILNMHPDHIRGGDQYEDPGNLTNPTGESLYNYFDTLTRFYMQDPYWQDQLPETYQLADFQFYQEPYTENDQAVYSLTSSYTPQTNRLLVTWNRDKNQNSVSDEVRYAFSDIHQIGWNAATAAPDGVIAPLGWQGYNGMVYDNSTLPLAGHRMVYIAIKPQNSDVFSEIAIILKGPGNAAAASAAQVSSQNSGSSTALNGNLSVTSAAVGAAALPFGRIIVTTPYSSESTFKSNLTTTSMVNVTDNQRSVSQVSLNQHDRSIEPFRVGVWATARATRTQVKQDIKGAESLTDVVVGSDLRLQS